MQQEIMLPVRPKWCELIASGKKIIEARKTIPKCDVPFKVYIYCTKDKGTSFWTGKRYAYADDSSHNLFDICGNGKVIGEFVCYERYPIHVLTDIQFSINTGLWSPFSERFLHDACLTPEEVIDYAGDREYVFGWTISDHIIYDKPKQLCVFGVKRPPQSFCYVERGDER